MNDLASLGLNILFLNMLIAIKFKCNYYVIVIDYRINKERPYSLQYRWGKINRPNPDLTELCLQNTHNQSFCIDHYSTEQELLKTLKRKLNDRKRKKFYVSHYSPNFPLT